MKKRIKFNGEFLSELIKRVESRPGQNRSTIVDAMNADRVEGRSSQTKVSLSQLSVWAENKEPFKLQRIISLVNNMEGVELSDFFVYEDGSSAAIKPKRSKKGAAADTETLDSVKEAYREAMRAKDDEIQTLKDMLDILKHRSNRQDYDAVSPLEGQ